MNEAKARPKVIWSPQLLTRDFTLVWWGQMVSQVGDGVSKLALLWFVYAITGSPLKTTIIGLLQTLPPILFGPFIGVIVDRLPKKLLLIGSDLIRAVDTAKPIAEATKLEIQVTPGLRERSVGVFTGLTFAEAEERYPDAFAALMRRESGVCPPEGETHHQASSRALAVLDEAVARQPLGRTLLVSHALTLYLVLLHVLGIEHATHAHKLFIRTDNCALHRLRRTPEGLWTVLALNDKSHLHDVTASKVDEV